MSPETYTGREVVARDERGAVVVGDRDDLERLRAGVRDEVGEPDRRADGEHRAGRRVGVLELGRRERVDRVDVALDRDDVTRVARAAEAEVDVAAVVDLDAGDVARLRVARAAVLVVAVGAARRRLGELVERRVRA